MFFPAFLISMMIAFRSFLLLIFWRPPSRINFYNNWLAWSLIVNISELYNNIPCNNENKPHRVNQTFATDGSDNVISITLRQVHSLPTFLNKSATPQSSKLANCPHEAGCIPFQTYSTFKIVEVPGIKHATSWLVIRHTDFSANEVVIITQINFWKYLSYKTYNFILLFYE